MHLHHDLAAGGERHAGPLREAVAAPAGRPRRDPVRVVQRVGDAGAVPGRQTRAAEAGPARPAALGVEQLRRMNLSGRDAEQDDVVNHLPLARLDACRRHERVACPLRIEEEAAVVVRHPRRRRRPVGRLHAQAQQLLAGATPGLCGAAGRARSRPPCRPPSPRRGSSRVCAVSVRVADRRTPGALLPGGHGGMRCADRARWSRTRRDLTCSSGNGAIPPPRDSRRTSRRCTGATSRVKLALVSRGIASAAKGTASAGTSASDGDPGARRMLGVICTPELAQRAADLADGAAGAERLAQRGQEIPIGLRDPAYLVERAPPRASPSSRIERHAVRSRWRRSTSGSTFKSSARSSPP